MTAYQRDFTIGLRETMDFYTFLTMRHWPKPANPFRQCRMVRKV